MLLTEKDARQRIQALPVGAEPRINWAGFHLPGEIAEGNLGVVGSAGTGKTLMHRELLRSVIPSIRPGSDRRALVFDVRCDLLSSVLAMNPASEVIVFNPFDTRSVAWDIAADVTTPNDARRLVESLIRPSNSGGSDFFIEAARTLVSGIVNSLNRTHYQNWTLRRIIHLTTNRTMLERVLAGSKLVEQYLSPANTFLNIQSTIGAAMLKLETVAALWEFAASKMSLKQWTKAGESILVLGENAALGAPLRRVNRLAFEIISTASLAGTESPQRPRLWFFCDDLSGAGQLDSFPILLTARSKGARCVFGFQDVEGLKRTYGTEESANEILSRCATVSWLKLNSAETAQLASKHCGNAILPSEFLDLPSFASGNVHGIHAIKGLGGVFKAASHYEFQKSDVLDFDPRPEVQQTLEPWGPEDDKWLNGGK